jgi:hypothetical protein
MRQEHLHGVYFSPAGIIVLDVQHVSECGPGDALFETVETALHEFVHFRHPGWAESRVSRWWKRKILPRRRLLVEFVEGLE